MAAATETPQPIPVPMQGPENPIPSRVVPIPTPKIQMSAPSPDDPMDISSPTRPSAAGDPGAKPSAKPIGAGNGGTNGVVSSAGTAASSPGGAGPEEAPRPNPSADQLAPPNSGPMSAPPAAAAPAVHQPKIVQAAFIHKLYNMLEDQSIRHLISWSPSAESFVMSPVADFSKVLAQYFKHTNISSFVRQLNMYGFHKVSDVFHTGNPETALWEFKHGAGNFKRGDLVGLREIKRRASKHSLVHREFNSQKPSPLQPGAPAEAMPMASDHQSDPRLAGFEHALYDMGMRLQRSEEATHHMHIKQQAMSEMLGKAMQFNNELSKTLLALVPSPDHPVHRDVVALQGEIQRQTDMLRTMDDHEPFTNPRQYFSNIDNAPVSPRQMAQDDPRRMTLAVPHITRGNNNNFHRPPVPSNLSISARRPFGSFGASTAQTSPSSLRGLPPPPPPPHPLTHVETPPNHLTRRHTSADIRAHGWQAAGHAPPYPPSGPPPPHPPPPIVNQWPPSPTRAGPDDQRLRDSLSSYSLQAASQQGRPNSRPATPPPPPFTNGGTGAPPEVTFGGWSFNSAGRGGDNKNLFVRDSSAPPTRRGSMAHILNPADTAEREGEDEEAETAGGDPRGDNDDRKRKRVQ